MTRFLITTAILFKPGLVCVPHVNPAQTDTSTGTSSGSSSTSSSETTSLTTAETMTTTVEAMCGDGAVEADEECDDGNKRSDDACLVTCKEARCGDDVVWADMEECDDGDLVDTNSCTASCQEARCGDGILWEGQEECDDGNLDDTDRCTSACKLPICGDGLKAKDEECDDGAGNVAKELAKPDECTTECQFACGDLTVSAAEECDDGAQLAGDGCSPMCADEYLFFVTNELYAADFGGIAGADEICQTAAELANLTGAYVAWLSAGVDSAKEDLPMGKVIIRTDGQIVVNTAEDLIKGPMTTLLHPLNLDQDGAVVTGYTWTGTSTQGALTGKDCGGWASIGGQLTDVGAPAATTFEWTNATFVEPLSQATCDATNHLYCFRKVDP